MKRTIHLPAIFALTVACLLSITTSALAGRPEVVKAVPDNGQVNVDPSGRLITITFDQNMSKNSYSLVGGGDRFPKILGKPRWMGPRTLVCAVRLQPNHEYWLSINSNKFTGFRNTRGEPAVPYPIAFTTGPAADGAKPAVGQLNRDAVDVLRRAVAESYSYRDLRGLDWDALFAKHKRAMEKADSAAAFAREAARLLAAAKDVHIWLRVDGQTIRTHRRTYRPNYNIDTLAKVVPNFHKHNRCVSTGRFDDGIGYILIRSWGRRDRDVLEIAFEALDDLAGTNGLIIDVRPNGGGSETLARHFAGCFIAKPAVYAKHATVWPDAPGGLAKPRQRILKPKKGRPKYRGRVAVLTGPAVISSCEAFLLMMKQVPGCKLMGAVSGGSSGNPKPVDLGNGVTVFLPSWKAMRPDGSCFEGEGIAPDIEVKTRPAQFVAGDPVIEAALKYLRSP